jgi:hypothetical protein
MMWDKDVRRLHALQHSRSVSTKAKATFTATETGSKMTNSTAGEVTPPVVYVPNSAAFDLPDSLAGPHFSALIRRFDPPQWPLTTTN